MTYDEHRARTVKLLTAHAVELLAYAKQVQQDEAVADTTPKHVARRGEECRAMLTAYTQYRREQLAAAFDHRFVPDGDF